LVVLVRLLPDATRHLLNPSTVPTQDHTNLVGFHAQEVPKRLSFCDFKCFAFVSFMEGLWKIKSGESFHTKNGMAITQLRRNLQGGWGGIGCAKSGIGELREKRVTAYSMRSA
jgi:hypothetical protein